jgi:hypothetical protein
MAEGRFGLGLRGVVTIAFVLTSAACKPKEWVRGPRTPACNDEVNRCMQSCGNQPAALDSRNQAVSDRSGTNTNGFGSSCEQTCASKC